MYKYTLDIQIYIVKYMTIYVKHRYMHGMSYLLDINNQKFKYQQNFFLV